MVVESVMVVSGMRVAVSRSHRGGGFTAELIFEGGDRAVVDAGSVEELDWLIEAVAYPAALARRGSPASCASAGSSSGSSAGSAPGSSGAGPASAGSDRPRNFF